MKKLNGENNSDETYKGSEASGSSSDDDTSIAGNKKISKAAKNRGKNCILIRDNLSGPSFFQEASKSKYNLTKYK